MAEIELKVTDTPDPADRDVILKGILAAGEAVAGPANPRPLVIPVRSADGTRVEGGLWGRTSWHWLIVELLFLPESRRGTGLGTKLMLLAEEEAVRRQCRGIWLDTFSFQARPFYEGLGFTCFGTIEAFMPGHDRFFMMKRLVQA
ncbi:MAG TPA: GNAT family N-acetyltransferase [Magnetospirillaceae bacterium]|jgi:GNAT superfamily N-acetyltransferase